MKGSSGAECLEIDQGEERVSARKLRVTRGPAKGAHCGMGEGQDRCLPLKTWEVRGRFRAGVRSTSTRSDGFRECTHGLGVQSFPA